MLVTRRASLDRPVCRSLRNRPVMREPELEHARRHDDQARESDEDASDVGCEHGGEDVLQVEPTTAFPAEQQLEPRPGQQRVADAGHEEPQPLGDPLEALPFALRIYEGGDEHPDRIGREPHGQYGEHQPAERLVQHQLHRASLAGDLPAASEGEAQGQHADQDGHDALGAEADAGHDVERRGGGAGGALEVGVGHLNRGAPPRLQRCRSFSSASSHRTRAWRQRDRDR